MCPLNLNFPSPSPPEPWYPPFYSLSLSLSESDSLGTSFKWTQTVFVILWPAHFSKSWTSPWSDKTKLGTGLNCLAYPCNAGLTSPVPSHWVSCLPTPPQVWGCTGVSEQVTLLLAEGVLALNVHRFTTGFTDAETLITASVLKSPLLSHFYLPRYSDLMLVHPVLRIYMVSFFSLSNLSLKIDK